MNHYLHDRKSIDKIKTLKKKKKEQGALQACYLEIWR